MAPRTERNSVTVANDALLAAVLDYARRSWACFPCHTPTPKGCSCHDRDCQSAGKHPRTRRGFLDATTDEDTLRQWWSQWPDANIGIATGESGLVVIDIDPRHGGDESWGDIVTRLGRHLNDTLEVETGSKGTHLYFKAIPGTPIGNVSSSDRFTGPLGVGVDVRAAGGYVIAPPSLHASGGRYEWIEDDRVLAPLPFDLADLLIPKDHTERQPMRSMGEILSGVGEGSRDWELFQAAAKLRYADVPRDLAEELILHAAARCMPPFPAKQALAKVESAYSRYAPSGGSHAAPAALTTDELPCQSSLIDWATFWDDDPRREDWLVDPIIPRGRSVALYSPAGAGKSLLSLDLAARLATGQQVMDRMAGEPVRTVYIDMEMTEADLRERLEDMGYGRGTDLSCLHYYLLPQLPPLDTPAGGDALMAIVRQHQAEIVILDTTSRIMSGGENDADTLRALYAHTGRQLKAADVTVLRLDHAGKDIDRGQRGTSAKADDVDLVWHLTVGDEGTVNLRATKRRQSWVPETVALSRLEEPLRHERAFDSWPQGTSETANDLDALGIDIHAPVRVCQDALKEAGKGRRRTVIVAAQRWRKRDLMSGTAVYTNISVMPGTDTAHKGEIESGNRNGNRSEPRSRRSGTGGVPTMGTPRVTPVPKPGDGDYNEEDDL